MEEILYIHQDLLDEMQNFCEHTLIEDVLNSFRNYGVIIVRQSPNNLPSHTWILENFITDGQPLRTWQVLTAFLQCGGEINFQNTRYTEFTGLLSYCCNHNYIDMTILEAISEDGFRYNYSNIIPHFE